METIPSLTFKIGSININDESNEPPGSLDSLTLGQLKSMVSAQPKPKPLQYAMRYEDEDNVFDEIEEFYSYTEIRYVESNMKAWQSSFHGEWLKTPAPERKAHVEVLLESLEHRDTEIRMTNASKLLYILQGTFAETTSPEHHLHMIIENCKIVRAANGVHDIVEALKIANAKHDLVSSLTDYDIQRFSISEAERQEALEDVNSEVSFYCGMLYMLVQIFKGDEEFGDELMSLEPPLPVLLFGMISSMKDKSMKGYPLKKVLLLLWKSELACLGGIRELARVKKLAREFADLPLPDESNIIIKSSPVDFKVFRQETSVKYPTFTPGPTTDVTMEKVATALSPIPIRSHHLQNVGEEEILIQNQMPRPQASMPQQLPPTPAPSPPPNGKPKKQQYQTDPNRPFLFPFSRTPAGYPQRLVPFAIDEADRLYMRHMHVSLALYQMWQTREAYILDESGVDPNSPEGAAALERKAASIFGGSNKQPRQPAHPTPNSDEIPESPLPDVRRLDGAIAEAQRVFDKAEVDGDRAMRRKAKERRDDLIRLRRAETLYVAYLPLLPSWVLVLLRLLLATVTAGGAQQNPMPAGTAGAFPQSVPDPPLPPPTLDELDINRHREITTKVVAALLLLNLKWFKVSHAMKFHHLGGLLLDSNCLLLILKIFGLQETSITVITKNDSPDHNFFRYCYLNFAKNVQHRRPEDIMLSAPRHPSGPSTNPGNIAPEDEIEYITEYSWRNFFSNITFVKIMQKLTKSRSHRIGMLVSYKSSAILKRILKVSHPMLQLQVLKLIKSQVPYCGRKWRQTNMKVITSIYLNCRPDLRDEWLAGNELEDHNDSLAQEQALRMLIKFYNGKRYGATTTSTQSSHRRTSSQSMHIPDAHLANPDLASINRPLASPHVEMDVFPPLRSRVTDPTIFMPYIPEDIAFEEEYEDYLSDLNQDDPSSSGGLDPWVVGSLDGVSKLSSAWQQRIEEFAGDIGDGISDSESIVSIGELGDEARPEGGLGDPETVDENLNNWEHMSPKTFKQLPKSPASGGRRSSSSGNNLRPVIPFDLGDGTAILDDYEDDDEPEMGPMPTGRTAPFGAGEGGRGVDEVEYMYGE